MRAKWAIGAAAAWCVGLLVAAVTLPAYTSVTSGGSTTITSVAAGIATAPAPPSTVVFTSNTSQTLVQVNGVYALFLLAIPLLMVIAVALLLGTKHPRLAWVVTAAVLVFCFLGAFTIGPFVFPVAILLVVACAQDYAYP